MARYGKEVGYAVTDAWNLMLDLMGGCKRIGKIIALAFTRQ
jgi:hypothetical protein